MIELAKKKMTNHYVFVTKLRMPKTKQKKPISNRQPSKNIIVSNLQSTESASFAIIAQAQAF